MRGCFGGFPCFVVDVAWYLCLPGRPVRWVELSGGEFPAVVLSLRLVWMVVVGGWDGLEVTRRG